MPVKDEMQSAVCMSANGECGVPEHMFYDLIQINNSEAHYVN